MANRNECCSDFSKQKTAKERWHSLVSRMGDREEYLETPLPLPRVCTDGRTFALLYADVITKFSRLDGYQFFLPMVLRWRASRAEAPLWPIVILSFQPRPVMLLATKSVNFPTDEKIHFLVSFLLPYSNAKIVLKIQSNRLQPKFSTRKHDSLL